MDGIADYTTYRVGGTLSKTDVSIPTSVKGGGLTFQVYDLTGQKELSPALTWEATRIGGKSEFLAYLQGEGSSTD